MGFTTKEITDEMYDLFEPQEGFNTVYYGKIGNGKTRNATADIIELLQHGEIVFANWEIKFDNFDETTDKKTVFAKFLGGRKHFFKFYKENFHLLNPDDLIQNKENSNVEFLSKLVGTHIFLDEGQWIFNSLERVTLDNPEAIAKTKLVLHGRHYCRSLNIITQRPSNVNKTLRSQVHIWYRCVKRFQAFGWIIFERWGIEDMKDDMPEEFITTYDKEGRAIKDSPNGKRKTYFVNTRTDKIFPAYNTHAMRAKDAIQFRPVFDAYELNFRQRLELLARTQFKWFFNLKKRIKKERSKKNESPLRKNGIVAHEQTAVHLKIHEAEEEKLCL